MAKTATIEVRVTGDVLALREALAGIEGDCRVLDRKDMWEEEGECYYDALRDIREKARAALSAPLKPSPDTAACKPMDLDEAIEHARACAARWGDETPCGYAHAQLACWLCELREHRKQAENAYAMREALKRVEDELAMMNPRGWGDTLAYVRKALAGRPRNCDLYKDCNAAWKAYNAIGDRERLPGFDHWLFEDAKQEGGAK